MREGTAPLERIAMLIRGLRHAGVCVLYQDSDLNVRLVENPFDSWPEVATIFVHGDSAIFEPRSAEAVIAAKRRVLETGHPERIEGNVQNAGFDCWYDVTVEADADASGRIRGLFVAAVDVTEHKRREETLRGLLAEVSHRSRNLLAIVQSILGQTMRLETDPADFASKLRGRIQALAITQDLVTQANWTGASFRHLVSAQLDPFTEPFPFGIEITGDDPQLGPNVAQHLGLALHELAANSARFGVLRARRGTIAIDMARSEDGAFLFRWRERHASPIEPGGARFGSAVLAGVLPNATGGIGRLNLTAEGVDYSLSIPQPGRD